MNDEDLGPDASAHLDDAFPAGLRAGRRPVGTVALVLKPDGSIDIHGTEVLGEWCQRHGKGLSVRLENRDGSAQVIDAGTAVDPLALATVQAMVKEPDPLMLVVTVPDRLTAQARASMIASLELVLGDKHPPVAILERGASIEAIRRPSPRWGERAIELANKVPSLRIQFDRDYGVDHRCGWTVTIDGTVWAELMPSIDEAMELAVVRYRAADQAREKQPDGWKLVKEIELTAELLADVAPISPAFGSIELNMRRLTSEVLGPMAIDEEGLDATVTAEEIRIKTRPPEPGAVVPLECTRCQGEGGLPFNEAASYQQTHTCPECKGTGFPAPAAPTCTCPSLLAGHLPGCPLHKLA